MKTQQIENTLDAKINENFKSMLKTRDVKAVTVLSNCLPVNLNFDTTIFFVYTKFCNVF